MSSPELVCQPSTRSSAQEATPRLARDKVLVVQRPHVTTIVHPACKYHMCLLQNSSVHPRDRSRSRPTRRAVVNLRSPCILLQEVKTHNTSRKEFSCSQSRSCLPIFTTIVRSRGNDRKTTRRSETPRHHDHSSREDHTCLLQVHRWCRRTQFDPSVTLR